MHAYIQYMSLTTISVQDNGGDALAGSQQGEHQPGGEDEGQGQAHPSLARSLLRNIIHAFMEILILY